MKQIIDRRLDDPNADAARRSHADAIRELQALPTSAARVIRGIHVTAPGNVTVAHRLGRPPIFVSVSAIRFLDSEATSLAAGTVYDRPTAVFGTTQPIDRSQVVVLAFVGFATAGSVHLTFDLEVF